MGRRLPRGDLRTGGIPDANAIPIGKDAADEAMDAATCIGCGACVAACPNASAMLFTSAKVAHLANLPQGQPERHSRVLDMILQMDAEGFGNCTNHGACENACPKGISIDYIAWLNRVGTASNLRNLVVIWWQSRLGRRANHAGIEVAHRQ